MSREPIPRHPVSNALLNVLEWSAAVGLALVITPFLVSNLGLEGYGLYAVFTTLTGTSAVLDLGIGPAVTKFVAQQRALGDSRAATASLNASVLLQAAYAVLVAMSILIFEGFILRSLNISEDLAGEARRALRSSAVGLVFTLLSGTLAAAMMGLQRYDVTAVVNSIAHIAIGVAATAVLLSGGRLSEAVFVSSAVPFATMMLYGLLLRRSPLRLGSHCLALTTQLRPVASFGMTLFLSKASQLLSNLGIRFIITALAGPSALSHYILPQRLVLAMGGFLSSGAAVLLPIAAGLAARRDPKATQRALFASLHIFALIATPAMLLLAALSREILTLWIGVSFAEQNRWTLTVLALGSLVASTSTIPAFFAYGLGRPRTVATCSLFVSAVLVVLIATLTKLVGVFGASIAVLLANIIWMIFAHHVCVRLEKIPARKYYRAAFGYPVIAGAVVTTPVLVMRSTPLGGSALSVAVFGATLLLLYASVLGFSLKQRIYKPFEPGASAE